MQVERAVSTFRDPIFHPGFVVAIALILTSVAPSALAQTNERLVPRTSFFGRDPGCPAWSAWARRSSASQTMQPRRSTILAGLSRICLSPSSRRVQRHAADGASHRRAGAGRHRGVRRISVFTPTFFSYVMPVGRSTIRDFRNSVQSVHSSFEFGARTVPRRRGSRGRGVRRGVDPGRELRRGRRLRREPVALGGRDLQPDAPGCRQPVTNRATG